MLLFRSVTLPNGLNVLAEPNSTAHSFAAGFFVRTGSRDEMLEAWGVSHFLEHMLFKGSDRLDWEAINRIFDEIGARYNAFTTQEMTAYYAAVIPEFTTPLVEHLHELIRPSLREKDFETEKNVILEEIAMYADEPGQRAYEKLMELHFDQDPLGRSVIGTEASIKAMTQPQMRRYFDSRYGAANTAIVMSGKFDVDEMFGLIEQTFHEMPTGELRPTRQSARPSGRTDRIVDPKLNRQYTMAMCPAPSAQDEDRFAARVLADVIGDAEGSRFYWALIDPAIAEDADFGYYPHDACGSFFLSLTSDPDKSEQSLDIARAELARVRKDLNESEVERARNKIAAQLTLGSENPLGRLRAIGSEWAYNRKYRSLDEDMNSLMSIKIDTLHRLLERYWFEPMTTITLGPK